MSKLFDSYLSLYRWIWEECFLFILDLANSNIKMKLKYLHSFRVDLKEKIINKSDCIIDIRIWENMEIIIKEKVEVILLNCF
jgi:folate-binding Fe-S cluster repair protein YgfZ